jgi:hypothetical protein
MPDPTPASQAARHRTRQRARMLRTEFEGQLAHLEELERWIKQTAGDDNHERIRADAVAVAMEHLRQAIDALELASQE